MTDVRPWTGVVLAGGRARRMGGVSKPALDVGGRRLLDVALAALAGGVERVVVGGDEPLPDGVRRLVEDPPGGGPVAALAAALAVVTTDVCVVLAADLPFVAPEHVEQLLAALSGASAAVAVDEGGVRQPLLAAYEVTALRAALPAQVDGAPMRSLLIAPVQEVQLTGERDPWFDCDTPEQLAAARAEHPSHP